MNVHLRIIAAALILAIPGIASAAGHHLALPSASDLWRVLSLQDYNTRVVILGTTMLGGAAGLIGTFLLLRKRSLLSDSIAHATLPGIAAAFIVVSLFGGDGKNLVGLLLGAAAFGTLGMGSVLLISKYSRLKDDAALGIVLSVFFGLGVSLLQLATRLETGNSAGLNSFIYGKTASMLFRDAMLIGVSAAGVAVICALLYKEFTVLAFDQDFAAAQGYPTGILDFCMMALVVLVTVIGLQAVGLILIVAMLVTPPAAARFWSFDLRRVLVTSGIIGAASGLFGSAISALMPNLPAGAIIVLVGAFLFLLSFLFGSARGVIPQRLKNRQTSLKVEMQHLMRAFYELAEEDGAAEELEKHPVKFEQLLRERAWNSTQLKRILRRARRGEFLRVGADGDYSLTRAGGRQARKFIRNHRLWEMYLITHADIAPSHVDRDADQIEHVLDDAMIERLENLMNQTDRRLLPESPHVISSQKGEAS